MGDGRPLSGAGSRCHTRQGFLGTDPGGDTVTNDTHPNPNTRDMTCPSCGRRVVETNYWNSLGTCLFCDLNQTGTPDPDAILGANQHNPTDTRYGH